MSLRASCIEGGLYVGRGAFLEHLPGVGPELRGVGRIELRHARTWNGVGTRPVSAPKPNQVVLRYRAYGARIEGSPAIVVAQMGRVIWVGRPHDVVEAQHPEFIKSGTAGILKYVLGEDMQHPTAPMAPPAPRIPSPCNYGETANFLGPVEDQIKAAELKAEALRQRQAEEQAAAAQQAITDARKAELAHVELIATTHGQLARAVQMLEAGNAPNVLTYPAVLEHRKELAPFVEAMGYKFVTVGLGGAVCLCKRGAK